jgi:uncharacterized membrane protein
MAAAEVRMPLHPLHAMLLAFPLAFFTGALISDLAYAASYQIQWSNFAQWLNAGALLGGGLAMVWALVDLARSRRRGRAALYFVLLAAMWIVGLIGAFVHSADAWGSMPAGLWLCAIAALLAAAAAWVGFSGVRAGDGR